MVIIGQGFPPAFGLRDQPGTFGENNLWPNSAGLHLAALDLDRWGFKDGHRSFPSWELASFEHNDAAPDRIHGLPVHSSGDLLASSGMAQSARTSLPRALGCETTFCACSRPPLVTPTSAIFLQFSLGRCLGGQPLDFCIRRRAARVRLRKPYPLLDCFLRGPTKRVTRVRHPITRCCRFG